MKPTPMLIAVLALGLASSALAQPAVELGTPATESAGSTGTGVSVLGGAASVSVGGSGALDVYSRSGTADGSVVLTPEVTAGDAELAPRIDVAGSGGRVIPAMALDPDGNGIVDPDEQEALRGFAAREPDCDGLIVSTATPEQIIAIERAQALDLILVCAKAAGLDAEKRAAIAANPVLLDRLATAGFGLGDVAGIVLDAQGRGTLYLAAS